MIGIIGAMPQEVDAILTYVTNPIKKTLYHHTVYEGMIHDQHVVICLSGVGKVAASMTTTLLLTNYNIQYVINIGTAGGLNVIQNTMDIVLATKVTQHDFDTTSIDGKEGLGLTYFANNQLVFKVREAFNKIALDCEIYEGEIVSGDIFVSETAQIEKILKNFPEAIACEMEAGAIGQVCAKFNVPFIVVRSLSDIVYHDNSGIDFIKNVAKTSARSAKMVEVLLNG